MLNRTDLLEDIAKRGCEVVMTNHMGNLRKIKYATDKVILKYGEIARHQVPVDQDHSFKDFTPNWDLIRLEIPRFRPDRKAVLKSQIISLKRMYRSVVGRVFGKPQGA